MILGCFDVRFHVVVSDLVSSRKQGVQGGLAGMARRICWNIQVPFCSSRKFETCSLHPGMRLMSCIDVFSRADSEYMGPVEIRQVFEWERLEKPISQSLKQQKRDET